MVGNIRTNPNLPAEGSYTHQGTRRQCSLGHGWNGGVSWVLGYLRNALLLGIGRAWRKTPCWAMEEPGVLSPGCWGSLMGTSYMWEGAGSAGQTMPGFQEELKHELLMPDLSLIIDG